MIVVLNVGIVLVVLAVGIDELFFGLNKARMSRLMF